MMISRRSLMTATATGTLAAVVPGLNVAFGATTASDILVVLFLRGASDGLSLVAPSGDADYIAARPTLKVPSSGAGAGLGLASLGGVDFFMHPDAPELYGLFTGGKLAVVHATGIPNGNRSHFEAQDMMELGIAPGEDAPHSGWLTRHIESLAAAPSVFGAVSNNAALPISLAGNASALAIPDVNSFNVNGGATNAALIRSITTGSSAYKSAATNTLDAVNVIQSGLPGVSNSPDAKYTTGPLSGRLKSLAKLIKMNVGLSIATVDQEGWDTHDDQAAEFQDRAVELSQSLKAFWDDMAEFQSRLTIVTMTEFGRRLSENESQGTDHGTASYMLVLGGSANGGRIYGSWPGLKTNQLRNGDLQVTTDSRQVLAELLMKRQGLNKISDVFPTLAYAPLGVVN